MTVTCLLGNSCLSRLKSSSIVSRGLSLMSSIFSQPMTCILHDSLKALLGLQWQGYLNRSSS